MFLFAPSGTFHVGDPVTVEIRVLNLGVGADPTNLSVYIANKATTRNLTYVRESTGLFTSTFRIESGDVAGHDFEGTTFVAVGANATLGALVCSAAIYLTVQVSPPPLQMILSASGDWVLPGATIPLNATVLLNQVPTDPTSLSVDASLATAGGGYVGTAEVPMTRLGTGLYHGTYQVPYDAPQDTTLSFGGQVAVGAEMTIANSLTFTVGRPHRYEVWYHVRAVESTYALVDILVANETAWPVEAANVSLAYSYVQPCGTAYCFLPRWVYETTNRLGAAVFNLTYSDIYTFVEFLFTGNVSVGERNQTYAGAVVSPGFYGAYLYQDLCPSDGYRSFAPGEAIRRTYHGLCGMGGPNQTYYYYAVSSQGVVANGSVVSDSAGNFNLSFTAPSESFYVFFNTYINAYLGWMTHRDFIRVADPALIHISNLSVGSVAHITVDIPGAGGTVSFLPYNASNMLNPMDSSWSPELRLRTGQEFPAVPGVAFHADFAIPRFLPKDQGYLLSVSVGDPGNLSYSYMYARVFHVSNLPPVASASFSTLNPFVGFGVTANTSGSTDPDGTVVAYSMDWGDGNSTGWTANPEGSHVYARPGTYTITVAVQDDSGAQATTTYAVVVDPAILGLRASSFYLITGAVVAVTAVVVVAWLYLRRRRPKAGGHSEDRPPEHGPDPPGDP